MTDSVDRLATPTRPGDWLKLVARTYEPTNRLTENFSPTAESSSNATPAGGQNDFNDFDDEVIHDHTPHVYVVYWPDIATLKIGISTTVRWEQWFRRGAVPVALLDTCCTEHARNIERWMLKRLGRYGAPAFKSEEEARFALGKKKGGYTECFRLVQSPRYGEEPTDEYDLERAYGLIMPREIEDDLTKYRFIRQTIRTDWKSA